MRKWIGLLVSVTAGCVTLSGCQLLMPENLLDTAPKNEFQVKYPQWGEVQETEVVTREAEINHVEGPYGERRSDSVGDLTHFLNQLGIAHEVVPGSHLMVKIKQKIHFKTGSAFVSAYSREWLSRIGTFLAGNENVDIIIDGHTDSTGKKATNDKLSQRRALQVKDVNKRLV